MRPTISGRDPAGSLDEGPGLVLAISPGGGAAERSGRQRREHRAGVRRGEADGAAVLRCADRHAHWRGCQPGNRGSRCERCPPEVLPVRPRRCTRGGGTAARTAPRHQRGPALETWILHELRAHLAHRGLGGELAYYRTPSGVEVDFVWTGPEHAVGIEVKAAGCCAPRRQRASGSARTACHQPRNRGLRRSRGRRMDRITVLPVLEFLRPVARSPSR